MTNYRILLQYEGTKYQGWQKQTSSDNTIQGKLEAILTKLEGVEVSVNGSGRTDSGVHAYGQLASFHLNTVISPQELLEYINRYLPEDIGVISCVPAAERFHARLNAVSKTYRYRIFLSQLPHVFERRYVWEYLEPINLERMEKAAEYLIGTQDFQAFTSAKKGKKSTVRTIQSIRFENVGNELQIWFKGDGFLYHMVRILTGTLLEIGSGEKKAESIKEIIDSKNRQNAGFLVPAKGLALMEVSYDS